MRLPSLHAYIPTSLPVPPPLRESVRRFRRHVPLRRPEAREEGRGWAGEGVHGKGAPSGRREREDEDAGAGGGLGEAGAEPLASPASPSLASLALGAFLWAQVVCGSVVERGVSKYERGPVQASACGARRTLGEGLGQSDVSSAPASC